MGAAITKLRAKVVDEQNNLNRIKFKQNTLCNFNCLSVMMPALALEGSLAIQQHRRERVPKCGLFYDMCEFRKLG
jgi:hypothetical protein